MAKSPSAYFTKNGRGKIVYQNKDTRRWGMIVDSCWKAALATCCSTPLIWSGPRRSREAARENLDQKLLFFAQKIERCKTDIGLKRFLGTLGLVVVRNRPKPSAVMYKGVLPYHDTLRIRNLSNSCRFDWECVLTRHPLESVRRYAEGILDGAKS